MSLCAGYVYRAARAAGWSEGGAQGSPATNEWALAGIQMEVKSYKM